MLRAIGHAAELNAFVQNLRGGHYELGTDTPPAHRLSAAFAELQAAI